MAATGVMACPANKDRPARPVSAVRPDQEAPLVHKAP